MRFFEWLLSEETLEGLTPKEKIGDGNFATVYATQNPKVVMRIEKSKDANHCEKFMADPKMQATGGVAKIYKSNQQDNNPSLSITYKERVNTNWSAYLANKYGDYLTSKYDISKIIQTMHYGPETAEQHGEIAAFLQLALEAFRTKNSIIEFLKNFPNETKGLIAAINMGLPFDDLHSDNLGINSDGKLVIIDC